MVEFHAGKFMPLVGVKKESDNVSDLRTTSQVKITNNIHRNMVVILRWKAPKISTVRERKLRYKFGNLYNASIQAIFKLRIFLITPNFPLRGKLIYENKLN